MKFLALANGDDATPLPTDPPRGTSPPSLPKAGDPCDPDNCRNTGFCQTFLRCDKNSSKYVEEFCGDEMFWNRDSGSVHGGNCDLLSNLGADLEAEYRSDKACLGCFWEAKGDCSSEYRYQAPNLRNRNVLDLECPTGLIFSEAKETCQLCGDVQAANGSSCCPPPAAG